MIQENYVYCETEYIFHNKDIVISFLNLVKYFIEQKQSKNLLVYDNLILDERLKNMLNLGRI